MKSKTSKNKSRRNKKSTKSYRRKQSGGLTFATKSGQLKSVESIVKQVTSSPPRPQVYTGHVSSAKKAASQFFGR